MIGVFKMRPVNVVHSSKTGRTSLWLSGEFLSRIGQKHTQRFNVNDAKYMFSYESM